MTGGEYVAAFASIIVALAVTDLANSMHKLLRARQRVQWDWLPLAAATLILFATLQFWWVFFGVWSVSTQFNLGGFLPTFATLLLLYFIASAALPDDVPAEGLDLKAYYLENRTYFWSLFLLLAVSATLTAVLPLLLQGANVGDVLRATLATGNLALVAIAAALLATRKRWVHAGLVVFMLAALVAQWVALTISG